MAGIKPGTPSEEVKRALGEPDDVRDEFDPDGIHWNQVKEIWGYGAAGHLGFPTLGSVYIDEGGVVKDISGGTGAPPPREFFSESQLRDLLRLLARVPAPSGARQADPLAIIRAVNAL
jgi:hypothetical protein